MKGSPAKGILFKKFGHLKVEGYTLADWAGLVDDRGSTSGYFTFVGGNLVTWRSKKQNVVTRSNAKAEYRGMVLGVCELLWLRHLLKDLGFSNSLPMQLFCDNQGARDIAHNLVQHDRMKHVEIDRFFIKKNLENKTIEIPPIKSEDQLTDILTKAIPRQAFSSVFSKLVMHDIYTQLEREF